MIALLGILSILALAALCSDNRRRIPLRTVGFALCLQVLFAALVLWLPAGQQVLNGVSESVSSVIGYGQEGIAFLFGELAKFKLGFIFAFNVLPVIIFFSALIAILYHIGLMPKVIALLGGGLQKLLGTGRAESLSATANIFVGMVEAPLVVKPYLSRMSDSQFFAVMSCGLASVAGGTLVGYASIGVELKYLIAAAFMSAPAGLAMAKILVPPAAQEEDHHEDVEIPRATNVIEAAADGAMAGLNIAVAVGATLLAFVGVIALLNGLLGWAGDLVGLELSFQIILGWLFAPVSWLIGVPWDQAQAAGALIGTKIVINEFVAFIALVQDQTLNESSKAIVTFALCGFANISSMAILIGGLGAMVPERKSFIARYGMRAILAGVLANLMSASLAGLFLAL
ncbi:NupC/NupG family nucleoside CNT transporter [Aeromonas caviae]|uniref:Nucleoside permease n=1 Tax=Aeromonas caviae TaxID=648 RepID=A0AA42R849_AERCA|nr:MULTISPECIES: NupC/NupG family nucleoside CNT transporter [Aeromonas]MDH0435457.1 NupC/NupG family nucleoside CNT transporter [Aeromonas caviae]MDH0938302.1 NupC/NupG family nucleoside CNT transporter [Aeromonas caviae]MDH1399135.1 NupC/NupG family nucleoside CNT transporter [Aeromonas caviae]MDH1505163.1 NupC/NupG family nucleoside CNT transporter [Aeromonas caviae]MDH1806306.1 NupC/NupG family nucleoside CNT transporter [Aeromonas caviae]